MLWLEGVHYGRWGEIPAPAHVASRAGWLEADAVWFGRLEAGVVLFYFPTVGVEVGVARNVLSLTFCVLQMTCSLGETGLQFRPSDVPWVGGARFSVRIRGSSSSARGVSRAPHVLWLPFMGCPLWRRNFPDMISLRCEGPCKSTFSASAPLGVLPLGLRDYLFGSRF